MKNIAMKVAAAALAVVLLAGCADSRQPKAIATDRQVEAKVESVLKGMTLKEKAGQMVQINIRMWK